MFWRVGTGEDGSVGGEQGDSTSTGGHRGSGLFIDSDDEPALTIPRRPGDGTMIWIRIFDELDGFVFLVW